MLERARSQRRSSTPSETILWESLRRKSLAGLKFRRQHVIGRFIADFYCHAARLIVEIDGAAHEGREDIDAARTEELMRHGVGVIRFEVADVETRLDWVLAKIRQEARTSIDKSRTV